METAPARHASPAISVVIPCYRSANTIRDVVTLTSEKLESLGLRYEFVLVNDCSPDNTFEEIKRLCATTKYVKGINLAKNAGQHNAVMAGLHEVKGDCVLCMDDDLQTHPSEIEKLVRRINEGWDVVFARYPMKKQSWFRSLGTSFARWTVRTLTDRPHNTCASSFWMAKRFVCDEIVKYPSPHTHLQGLLFRTTEKITDTEVVHYERESGSSGYSLKKLVRQWAMILNYSVLPLRLATLAGVIIGAGGLVGAGIALAQKIIDPATQLGWTSVMFVMLCCFGLNLLCIGMLGEYLGRVFMTIDRHPQYVVAQKLNCEEGA